MARRTLRVVLPGGEEAYPEYDKNGIHCPLTPSCGRKILVSQESSYHHFFAAAQNTIVILDHVSGDASAGSARGERAREAVVPTV